MCIYVYVCVHICAHIHVCMYVLVSILYMYMCTCMNILPFLSLSVFDGFEVQNTTTLINVTIGQPVAIPCGVRNAAPPPIIVWYKINEVLDTTSNTNKICTLDNGNTLVIYDLGTDDITSNGSPVEYRCGVTNARMFETVNSTQVFNLVEGKYWICIIHVYVTTSSRG